MDGIHLMTDKPWVIEYPQEYMLRNNYYLINGVEYERVTGILGIKAKPGLRYWQGSVGNAKAKSILFQSGQFGSTAHQIIEWMLTDVKVDILNYKVEMQECINAWKNEWYDKHKVVVEGIEVPLFDSDLRCAGTCDFIGVVDGKRYIGDWKTSGAIYDTYWMQLAAYAKMFTKLTGVKLDGVFIVRIKNGTLQEEVYADMEDIEEVLYPGFLHAHGLHMWDKQMREWLKHGRT